MIELPINIGYIKCTMPPNSNSSPKSIAPSIFQFLDYRQFLKVMCDWKKANTRSFSQRKFIQDAGLPESSSSFLPSVIKGRRNLSQKQRVNFGLALGLKDKDYGYWDILVQFNQAKGMVDKNFFFEQLQKFHLSRAHILSEPQLRYYSKWYYSALWNYLALHPNQNHPAIIAKNFFPAITAQEVKDAIDLLLEIGLIFRTANGYQTAKPHVSSAKDVKSTLVKQHIKDFTQLSIDVLPKIPASHRQYNALIFGIDEKGFLAIKERIRSFQEELRGIIDQTQKGDRVYTLTMQLFPNTILPENSLDLIAESATTKNAR